MTGTDLMLRTPQSLPRARDHLRRELILGGGLAGGFLLASLIWAATARLDAAVAAPGAVRVSGERHVIQNLESGSVSALPVREGQHVRKGQVLVQFASAAAVAQERALAIRTIGLQAQVARLEALQGNAGMVVPPSFAMLTGEDKAEADRAISIARTQLQSDREIERVAQATLGSRLQQIDNQIGGMARRGQSSRTQIGLNDQELTQVKGLAEKGYAPKSRVLALERSAASLQGDIGAIQSEIARLRSSAGEANLDSVQSRQQRAERRADDLRQARADLQTALPQWQAARDSLARTRIVAPVAGTVLGLSVFSAGAVAAPGQKLMEIVPDDRALEIDAQIPAGSANDMAVGQEAQVHLMGAHGRTTPALKGVVKRVSPDSLLDERTGHAFYTATVRVEEADLRRALGTDNPSAEVRPGTPVSLQISLYPRTALQYWFEPLSQAFRGALHER